MRKLVALLVLALPLFADVAERRAKVENGLLPAVLLENEPAMRLEDRMKRYGVPGLSLAVWKWLP